MKTLNWRTIFLRLLSFSAYFVLPASFQLVNSRLFSAKKEKKERNVKKFSSRKVPLHTVARLEITIELSRVKNQEIHRLRNHAADLLIDILRKRVRSNRASTWQEVSIVINSLIIKLSQECLRLKRFRVSVGVSAPPLECQRFSGNAHRRRCIVNAHMARFRWTSCLFPPLSLSLSLSLSFCLASLNLIIFCKQRFR